MSSRVEYSGNSKRQTTPPCSRAINSGPSDAMAPGERSAANTSCEPARCKASTVCISSSSVTFLPAKNWMSSITSRPTSRYLRRKFGNPLPCSASRNWLVNCSADRYTAAALRRYLRNALTMPSHKWVFPTPLGPWITSGDRLPGFAAASSADLCARQLDCPMTKLSSEWSGRRRGIPGQVSGAMLSMISPAMPLFLCPPAKPPLFTVCATGGTLGAETCTTAAALVADTPQDSPAPLIAAAPLASTCVTSEEAIFELEGSCGPAKSATDGAQPCAPSAASARPPPDGSSAESMRNSSIIGRPNVTSQQAARSARKWFLSQSWKKRLAATTVKVSPCTCSCVRGPNHTS